MDLILRSSHGTIRCALRPDVAPQTVEYVMAFIRAGYGPRVFYRSDFVLQCGRTGSGAAPSPLPPLAVNESSRSPRLSCLRGAVALAHFDAPDCGSTEIFIVITDSPHLDTALGGFVPFAQVSPEDAQSWATVASLARAVAAGGFPACGGKIVRKGFL